MKEKEESVVKKKIASKKKYDTEIVPAKPENQRAEQILAGIFYRLDSTIERSNRMIPRVQAINEELRKMADHNR